MRDKPLNETEKRAVSILLRRRIGVITVLNLVWIVLMWFLWCFPHSRSVHGGKDIRTSYGILQWQDLTAAGEQVAIATLVPLRTAGTRRIHALAVTVTTVLCIGTTAFIGAYASRSMRNLTPRWRCQQCGYIVSAGSPRSNVCPECGELPNLQKEPWAFWR